jgi:hypothetical protein
MRVSEEFIEWGICISLWGSSLLIIAFSSPASSVFGLLQ